MESGKSEKGEQTSFAHDIEVRVFQAIAIKCLAGIEGIGFLEGTLFDHLLGREGLERIKGIYIELDTKHQSINLKVELSIAYGLSIPKKAEEIQEKLAKDIFDFTGMNIASFHVIFKNIFFEDGFDETIDRPRKNQHDDRDLFEEASLEDSLTAFQK